MSPITKSVDSIKTSLSFGWFFMFVFALSQEISAQTFTFTTLAGSAGNSGSSDGTGSVARFKNPTGVASDGSGNVYVADTDNHTIRKIATNGVVSTLAGLAGASGGADGAGSVARFWQPAGLAIDGSGNVFVAEISNHTIRKVSPGGVVTTLAGRPGVGAYVDGLGAAARFLGPSAVGVTAIGTVYVADTNNHMIRMITSGAMVTSAAGSAGLRGNTDGAGSAARFHLPMGVAVDSAGNAYVADTNNHTIRKISVDGMVVTVAGVSGSTGDTDGGGSTARFSNPSGMAADRSGNLYVTDMANHTIRKISSAGLVTTVAGVARSSGRSDGTGSAASFNFPMGVAIDSAGNVYVADSMNHTIRKGVPVSPPDIVVQPTVSNLVANQAAGTRSVAVTYTLSHPQSLPCTVTMQASRDNGATWEAVGSVEGAIGPGVTTSAAGLVKSVIWNAGADWPAQSFPQVRIRITADDGQGGGVAPAGFALIPAGTFTMGDNLDGMTDAPTHAVTLAAFYFAKTETTKAEWEEVRAWAATHGYGDLALGAGRADTHPVHTVSWYDVVKWLNARSEKDGLVPAYYTNDPQTTVYRNGSVDVTNAQVKWAASGYRLPTEAEWEYAARGGLAGRRYPWGDTITHQQANYNSTISYSFDVSTTRGFHPTYAMGGQPYTSPVGSFAANGYGLQDMSGNVFEWCWDWYGSYGSAPVAAPLGPTSGMHRVLRGGSWFNYANYARLTDRYESNAIDRYHYLGFRPVRGSGAAGGATSAGSASFALNLSNYAGTYFGNFDGGRGSWALIVRSDGIGTYVAYLSNPPGGIVATVAVAADGTFRAAGSLLQPQAGAQWIKGRSVAGAGAPYTLIGSIGATGVTGTLDGPGVAFAGTPDAPTGATAAVSGLYQAGNATTTTYTVVGTDRRVLALTIGSTIVDGGLGSIGNNGTFTVTTPANTLVTGSVTPATGTITATVTPASGTAITVTGSATLGLGPPFVATAPAARTVAAGAPVSFAVTMGGKTPMAYQWSKNGDALVGATGATFAIGSAQLEHAGNYTCLVTNSEGNAITSAAGLIVVAAGASFPAARLVNLSIRTELRPAGDSFTLGYVVGGEGVAGPKLFVIRAAGPSLGALGVSGALEDPKLELFVGARKTGENDNWGGASDLSAVFAEVGAFPFAAATSRDAAVCASIATKENSARVSATGSDTGEVIAELYDAAQANPTAPRLVNVSVLKHLGSGLTAGFVIGGTGSKTVLVRAVGPTLGSAPFNVPGVVADPQLTLYSGQTPLRANDNWGGTTELATAFASVGAFALPATSRDAALLATLPPGAYTVQVSGVANTTGVAIVEVYEVP